MVRLDVVKKKGYPPGAYNPRKIHEANMWCVSCGGIKSGLKRVMKERGVAISYTECLLCGKLDEYVSHSLYIKDDKRADKVLDD